MWPGMDRDVATQNLNKELAGQRLLLTSTEDIINGPVPDRCTG